MHRASLRYRRRAVLGTLFLLAVPVRAQNPDSDLGPPKVGCSELRVLTPTVLEEFLVNTQGPEAEDRPTPWDWVDEKTGAYKESFPTAASLMVLCEGRRVPVARLGFRRTPIFAPLPNRVRGEARDLRIGNFLLIELQDPLPDGARVEVRPPEGEHDWPAALSFSGEVDPARYSPVIHISQTGYEPSWPKRAQVGYYCGTLGELPVTAREFEVFRSGEAEPIFTGKLKQRQDVGFAVTPAPYQQVLEADFSTVQRPGEYQIRVPGLGKSHRFRIEEGASGALARALALGLFHQRDGANRQELPWTRFVDGPAHLAPAEVMTNEPEFAKAWSFARGMSTPSREQMAPALVDFSSALFPPVKRGEVDVSGGHRDAGDYSKYTINTAGTVAVLMFAVDCLSGVRELDNLGIPESGDGISDLLQEAKYEADFLAKLQDDDGGFWFLVYPKNRAYEGNVLPSAGDSQVLFPKNTSATAAAVGALAQAASSHALKDSYPEAAALYRAKAEAGWAFLERARTAHGRDGAYQRVTHYGDEFLDRDERAFASAGMFALTGDKRYEAALQQLVPDPGSESVRRWTWWPLFEGYGHAFRTYAFASRAGAVDRAKFDAAYLEKVEHALLAGGEAALQSSRDCAYGSSYDGAFKRALKAGYHFSSSIAFDLAVAAELAPDATARKAFRDAVVSNVCYTTGSNPGNWCFVTGLGWRFVRNAVSQYALNAERFLPPTGLPVGEISEGPSSFVPYRTPGGQNLLAQLIFPAGPTGTPIYDRSIDCFDVGNEATIVEQARAAATALWLFAQTSLRSQRWVAPAATVVTTSGAIELRAAGVDLTDANIVWEARGRDPIVGGTIPVGDAKGWIEAEAVFPDGRRVFARETGVR